MTSRELADAIDLLVKQRIAHEWETERAKREALAEQIELTKRSLADAFKRLDHNRGVYRDEPHC